MDFTNIVFVASFIGLLCMSIWLLPYAGMSIFRFSIPSLFVGYYLLTAYLGILPLYFGWDVVRVENGIVDKEIILKMYFYTSTTLILVIVGFIFSHQFIGLQAHRSDRTSVRPANWHERGVFLVLLIACMAVLALYLSRVSAVALVLALQGSLADAAIARSQMGNAFAGEYWRYQLFFGPLLTMCCVFYYTDANKSQNRFSSAMFLLTFATALYASVMAIEKYPLMNLMLAIYLGYAVVRGGRYWQPALKYLLAVSVALSVVMIMVFQGSQDVAEGFVALLSRIFTGGIAPAYHYLEIFPRNIEFLYGTSMPNPGGVLPFESFELTREVMRIIEPEYSLEIVGSAPTVFWAEMYANFGFLGVLVAPFLVGVVIYAAQHFLASAVVTPTIVATTIVVASHFKELASTGLSSYLFDGVLLAIATVCVIALAARNFPIALYQQYSQKRTTKVVT